jgi:hypothetical protein
MSARKKNRSRPRLPPKSAAGDTPAANRDHWRPWLLAGVAALFVARPLLPIEGRPLVESGDGMPFVMAWCLLATLWALGRILRGGRTIRWGATDWAVMGLLGWHSASGVWGMYHGAPRPALNMLWEWIGLGLGFFLVRQLVDCGREVRALVALMAALAVAHSIYGLYQHLHTIPATQEAYEADPNAALRDAGLWYPEGSPERRQFEDRLLYGREPFSTFSLTNSLAGYLVPWLAVLLGMAASALGQERRRGATIAGTLVAAFLVMGCLVLTNSRSGWLAFLAGVVGLCVLQARQSRGSVRLRWWAANAAVFVVLGAGAVSVAIIRPDMLTAAKKSLLYRFEYWQASAAMIADHPFLGVGPGNFQARYTQYKLPQSEEEVLDPHNFLVEVWATAGTPAALLLLTVLSLFIWRSLHSLPAGADSPSAGSRTGGMPEASPLLLAGGLAGIVLAWLVGSIVTTGPLTDALLVILPSLSLALLLLYPWIQGGTLGPGLPLVAVVALLVNLLAAGGIGFPGVAGSFWVLLAVGLVECTDTDQTVALRSGLINERLDRGSIEARGAGRAPGKRLACSLIMLAGLASLGIACYLTGFRPVMERQAAERRAQSDPRHARRHLEQAARSDPWSSEPCLQRAAVELAWWHEDRSERTFSEFERFAARGLALAPHSSSAWMEVGDWYQEAFHVSGEPKRAALAAAKYKHAKDLYPTSALHWAKLALALSAAGDLVSAQAARNAALRLHAHAHHPTKKLSDELVARLERIR